MRTALFALLSVGLAGCPQVNVESVNLDVPIGGAPAPERVDAGVSDLAPSKQAVADSPTSTTQAASPPSNHMESSDDDAGIAVELPDTRPDFDHDGIPDTLDVCPIDNPNDIDHDGKCNSQDPCPLDAFDDRDHDGVCDSADVCPSGDVDTDGDGVCDPDDSCPQDAPNDSDSDGQCDSSDPCPLDANDDSDDDGICDSFDACPNDATNDSDNDGVCDSADVCNDHDDRLDSDHDGIADGCDVCPGFSDHADDDGDTVPNGCDQCPAGDDRVLVDGHVIAACDQLLGMAQSDARPSLSAREAEDLRNGAFAYALLRIGDHEYSRFLSASSNPLTSSDVATLQAILNTPGPHTLQTFFQYGSRTIEGSSLVVDSHPHVTRVRVLWDNGGARTRWEIRGY